MSLPCEPERTNCPCCAKHKFDMDWTFDLIEGCMEQILEAIGDFGEFYHATMQSVNACSVTKKLNKEVLKEVVKMNEENKEQLQNFVAEQQVLLANISNHKEERVHQFVAKQEAAMPKANQEREKREKRMQKFMEEQRVEMAKIISNAMKASVTDAAQESKTCLDPQRADFASEQLELIRSE